MNKLDGSPKSSMEEVMAVLQRSSDFIRFEAEGTEVHYWVSYFRTLVDPKILQESILPYAAGKQWGQLQDLKDMLPMEEASISIDTDDIREKLNQGYVMISSSRYALPCLLIKATLNRTRAVTVPEVEFSVIGPKEAFVESIDTNLNLIRKRLPADDLKVRELQVGDISKTVIAVVYLENIAEKENVNTVWQRISDIQYDQIVDSSFITQIIADNQHSPFPQLLDTERSDRAASAIAQGKVAIVVDGSPHVLLGPTTLMEFFFAFDDYYFNYILASFFRMLRLFSVAFSILVTPVYVAALNYHYELIPRDLLNTLVSSRGNVPLTPLLEVLFLELGIELLREAGARLPTKVGQTIGIVGGIVIGTASVDAGLTSNVLLIIVALAALASFSTPLYLVSNTIRFLRFPFLFFAEFYGLVGIVFCFNFLAVHLLRLTSLGRPYLAPIFPPRLKDMKDSFIRLPYSVMTKRPVQLRTKDEKKTDPKKAKQNKDIDE
ncbi:spore germination protein [Metabacillus sp. GX 13764]|uniref:spore germination protein n=1 Tax=Metabacillus kandeliae TaxID=2900151 RepID=UPI001E443129|nr:spore germination protein [Metabacillus kandeliae]MCD7036132.1 spore germination protein [Metabacillus kandeliae]